MVSGLRAGQLLAGIKGMAAQILGAGRVRPQVKRVSGLRFEHPVRVAREDDGRLSTDIVKAARANVKPDELGHFSVVKKEGW